MKRRNNEQTRARGKDSDPHEQTKSLSDLESEMIQNILRTISGENKATITQRLHRSIRNVFKRTLQMLHYTTVFLEMGSRSKR
jgi:hypothetical protein